MKQLHMLFLDMIVTSCLPEGRLFALCIIKELVLNTVTFCVNGHPTIFSLLIIDRNGWLWCFEHFIEGREVLRHFDFAFVHVPKYLHLALIGRIVKLRGVLSDALAC